MKTVASYNVKGGVGKTSAAVNLAYLSAQEGRRTLLWDLDPQGAATFMFRIRAKVKGGSRRLVRGARPMLDAVKATDFDQLDLLPADFTYRHMDIDLNERARPERTLRKLLRPLAPEYDVVLLDVPPSLSLVSENVLTAADLVLAPLVPTVLSVRTFDQLLALVDGLDGRRPVVRGYFSMVDRRRSLHRDIVSSLPKEQPRLSATAVPIASNVEQMAVRRQPVTFFAPRSAAGVAFTELWAEVRDLLGLDVTSSAAAPA
ncbi:MAG TPA: ParA family protein [Jatrophihabitans sp.]|nr:ParA family protein [Jatrophihabitans sp.]